MELKQVVPFILYFFAKYLKKKNRKYQELTLLSIYSPNWRNCTNDQLTNLQGELFQTFSGLLFLLIGRTYICLFCI